jgi:hypothetical protein
MTRQERIHNLFNELHRELTNEVVEASLSDLRYLEGIRSSIDAAHHDYTNIVLARMTD